MTRGCQDQDRRADQGIQEPHPMTHAVGDPFTARLCALDS